MKAVPATTLISIGASGASLTVVVRRQATRSPGEPWFDTEITADAFPFGGRLETVLTMSDLREWGEGLSGLTAGTGRVVLGGNRAAQLVIEAEPQEGENPDLRAICVDVTPSWSETGSRIEVLD